jgi:MFS family permease
MAVLFFSSSAGGVTLPILVQAIIMTWSWRLAWVILRVIMIVLGLLPCALLVKREPGELGLSVDGATVPEAVAKPPLTAEEGVHAVASEGHELWQLDKALKMPTLWLLLIGIFMGGVACTGVGLHVVPHLIQQGVAPQAAVGAVSISFLMSSLGTLLWGFTADRLSARYLLAVVQGFSDAGLGLLPTVLLANYYGSQHLGSIYGLLRAVQVEGFALGPLISGIAFDITQNYHAAFVAFLALSVIGTALVTLARQPQRHRRVQ